MITGLFYNIMTCQRSGITVMVRTMKIYRSHSGGSIITYTITLLQKSLMHIMTPGTIKLASEAQQDDQFILCQEAALTNENPEKHRDESSNIVKLQSELFLFPPCFELFHTCVCYRLKQHCEPHISIICQNNQAVASVLGFCGSTCF